MVRKSQDGDPEYEDLEEEITNVCDSESDVIVIQRPRETGRKSRSVNAIPNHLQRLCFVAIEWVTDFTFFTKPFIGSMEVIDMINDAWDWAQDAESSYHEKTTPCGTYVSLS